MAKKPRKATQTTISATEASRRFSELLSRILYRRESYLVERAGRAVCEMRPVYRAGGFAGADLATLLRSLPQAPEKYLVAVAEGIDEQPRAERTRWRR